MNKKAILGMLVAIVMSLGVMNGINSRKDAPDTNLIWGIGSTLVAYDTESSLAAQIGLSCFGTIVSAGYGAMYGSLCGPGWGTAVGFVVGL